MEFPLLKGRALMGFSHVWEDQRIVLHGDGDDLMSGLDFLGIDDSMVGAAAPARAQWDEVVTPYKVILNPRAGMSTVFGDPMRGTPSGVARVAVSGGSHSKPDPTFMVDANVWDTSAGGSPTATVYFLNGSKQAFAGLQAVTTQGGTYRSGVQQRRGWFARTFGGG